MVASYSSGHYKKSDFEYILKVDPIRVADSLDIEWGNTVAFGLSNWNDAEDWKKQAWTGRSRAALYVQFEKPVRKRCAEVT